MSLCLFTDGSVDPKSKVGYGAYLAVENIQQSPEDLNSKIRSKTFKATSSTRLELETLLWALEELSPSNVPITLYTDSQNIVRLPGRRERLETSDFHSKAGDPIKNADLYLKFYDAIDRLEIEIVKVKGHQRTSEKSKIEKIFTLVDRASRKALKASRNLSS